jgi:hypothetical protein
MLRRSFLGLRMMTKLKNSELEEDQISTLGARDLCSKWINLSCLYFDPSDRSLSCGLIDGI